MTGNTRPSTRRQLSTSFVVSRSPSPLYEEDHDVNFGRERTELEGEGNVWSIRRFFRRREMTCTSVATFTGDSFRARRTVKYCN
jgi:hypothetical protein